MAQQEPSRAAEVVRALAGAAKALTLYPPTSHLPGEAVERFVALANVATSELGHLRYIVEPNGFKIGEDVFGEEIPQVVELAKHLYSHQVGQLLVAPDLVDDEVVTFLGCVSRDPTELKQIGGIRHTLAQSGISHLAVIEVTLRATEEEGLKGLDLVAAPLEEIGPKVVDAVGRWVETSAAGTGVDELSEAIGAMETATRDIATGRVAEALMRLDEATRAKVLAGATGRDSSGHLMEGMLSVIAQMGPATLSRLLVLAAGDRGESPLDVLGRLEIPDGLMRELASMLSPSPQSEESRGVPPDPDIATTAAVMEVDEEADAVEIERQVARSAPALAAGRALRTSVVVAEGHRDAASVEALGHAIPPAVRAGAFDEVQKALAHLDELWTSADLSMEATAARQTLADESLLQVSCDSLAGGASPDAVAAILTAAGSTGVEYAVARWISADEAERQRLKAVVPRLGEHALATIGKAMRSADAATATAMLSLLVSIGDRRAMPVVARALEHPDQSVRVASLQALAASPSPESARALADALEHSDSRIGVAAAEAIGAAHVQAALPAMLHVLEGYHLIEREYDLKHAIVRAIEAMGARDAAPVLESIAGRRFTLGSGNRRLKAVARQTASRLRRMQDTGSEE